MEIKKTRKKILVVLSNGKQISGNYSPEYMKNSTFGFTYAFLGGKNEIFFPWSSILYISITDEIVDD